MKLLICLAIATSLGGCKPRGFNSLEPSDVSSSTKQTTFADFCTASESNTTLWNAQQVQQEITKLIGLPGYKSSGLSAYAEAYRAMTFERDKSRCAESGAMVPKSEISRRLNDALADFMTKGFVLSQSACLTSLASSKTKIPDIGAQLCALSKQALAERWTALELAMGSTGLYLSSLMGISLSALPHVDALWENTPHRSLEQRIVAMQEFKPTYDAFNLFLSRNLHTVARVLLKEKRINCKLFEAAARAAEITRAPEHIFKEIRDVTFELGLELSRSWPKGLHPLTAGEPTWNVERQFGSFAKEPNALVKLREHGARSVGILKHPLLKVFDGKDAATFVTFEGLTCEMQK